MKHYVEDLKWEKGMSVNKLVEEMGGLGFQSVHLNKAKDVIIKMKKNGAKIYFTFTSNMVTSGLRGLFAQLIKLNLVDVVVTTVGGIEEDIMRAQGEKFLVGSFKADDFGLHEKGFNRVGNLLIKNESYEKFETNMKQMLKKVYDKKKRVSVSELLKELGSQLKDENSILYQAHKNNIPIFCPAITDGAFGFHLYLFQQDHKDFIVDVVQDFFNLICTTDQDELKGLIALGGGVSKHHAILGALINGGLDYAVYLTTSHSSSGSMSGATTKEAKSWGKIKDDASASTLIGEVTITFPLIIFSVLDQLAEEGLIKNE
ncbi:deoxyhypusine synthase family protein [Candidatus Woesearchaeota archaeon]|nr:deoxyhypusine synthase family protein [Candidatus Woesearchaeota archaeon]